MDRRQSSIPREFGFQVIHGAIVSAGGKVLTRLDNAGHKSSTVFDVDGSLTAVQNLNLFRIKASAGRMSTVGIE